MPNSKAWMTTSMMRNSTKLSPFDRSSQAALYGPRDDHWTEPDWEAMELGERARQGLSQTLNEEES